MVKKIKNILLCSFHEDCGTKDIKQMLTSMIEEGIIENISITESYNFFSIYNTLNNYDIIILCRRNVLSITSDKLKINKYIQDYNCWTLFATIIIPYEANTETKLSFLYKAIVNTLDPIPEHAIVNNSNLLTSFMNSNYINNNFV